MGWKQAGFIRQKSRAQYALGRPDNFDETSGELHLSNLLWYEPLMVVEFLVENHFACAPARRE